MTQFYNTTCPGQCQVTTPMQSTDTIFSTDKAVQTTQPVQSTDTIFSTAQIVQTTQPIESTETFGTTDQAVQTTQPVESTETLSTTEQAVQTAEPTMLPTKTPTMLPTKTPIVETTDIVSTTGQAEQTTEQVTCDWTPISSSECSSINVPNLPECSTSMSEGDLCEADKRLPNGSSNFNINNCGSYDVFRYSCSVSKRCDYVPISTSECPRDNGRNLADCKLNMSEGELCEADSTLPNGARNFNINNCGSYDVFRYTCGSNVVTTEISTTQQTVSFTDHGAGKCQTSDGSDPTHVYVHGVGFSACESSCDSSSACFGFSVSSFGNCLLWNQQNIVGGGASWGGARCYIKTSGQVTTFEPTVAPTANPVETTQAATCDWTPISASECPSDDGRNLPECSTSMSEGELCEADRRLPNGNSNYNINNCGNYDVFKYSCGGSTVCNYVPISTSQCPSDNGRSLADCTLNMSEGELCEADSNLPNGATNFNINNCGSYDVFKYTCTVDNVVPARIETTQPTGMYTNQGAGKCQTRSGSDPAHEYFHNVGFSSCESTCNSRSDCHGFSVSSYGNCLIWLQQDLMGGGASWGSANCFIKNSRRRLLNNIDIIQDNIPSDMNKVRKH